MSALPGLSGARRPPMGQINSKTTQRGVSDNGSHHRQPTGKTIIKRVALTETVMALAGHSWTRSLVNLYVWGSCAAN